MCAIAGLYQPGHPVDPITLMAMIRIQAHRGPDGEGLVLLSTHPGYQPIVLKGPLQEREASRQAPEYCVGFGHRRLAILDLSPLGHQPMSSEDGNCWVTYNGEIYNHIELRRELQTKGYRFRSTSDTEVLLAAYSAWGESCVARFNGMFAFALWDARRQRLFCARDRMGVKPFYYSWTGERFVFASEIKALLAAGVQPRPDRRAVFDYLEGAYLDYSEGTFFEGIQQLLPAHTLTLQGDNLVVRRFWDLPEAGEETELSLQEAAAQFQDLFRDSVQIRLRSDVPIGSCLSGGLDSSSIVCVANELMFGTGEVSAAIVGTRQKTFSSCFEDLRYDERRFIQPVLNRTGAQAHYTFPDPKELAANVYEVIRQQEEPFGSTSIFAQWNVMRLASQCGVKVLLDGQGADELLGGYQGFFGAFFGDLIAKRRWALLLNEMVRYRRLHGPIQSYVLANLARAFLPKQLVQFTRSRITGSVDWITADFRRQWAPIPSGPAFPSNFLTLQHSLLTRNGLRALLHYEDRNSMAFGVETRLPFLDYRVVEFLYRLRPEYKIRNGWTKMLLRQAMDGLLPDEIRWRTDKMGFVTPEDIWFRTSWREMAREILCDRRTRERGYVNCAAAFKEFEAHAAGQRNISFTIWRWLNLELWSRTFLDQPGWNAALS